MWKMGKDENKKNVHAFQHEHKGRVVNMKLGKPVNSGVGGDNTKHKGLG
jgi:hypothetical protein|nr:MAG TPA: hypothetical protein [Caudoviricetes sp.]